MKKAFLSVILLAVLASGICAAQNNIKPLRLEASMGTLTNWQKLSIYDNGFSNMRCPTSDIILSYEVFRDTAALGVKFNSYTFEEQATDEYFSISFVAANFRYFYPLQFTDKIKIRPYFEAAFGCAFLKDWFSYNETDYKTTRRGFGMDCALGIEIPFTNYFTAGLKCGYFVAFPSKVDVAAEVPAENYKLGDQIINSTRVMATFSIEF